jgi:hypothetical protein
MRCFVHRLPVALLILSIFLCVSAGATDAQKNVSTDELIHIVAVAQGTPDADLAQKFSSLVLTDRLSGPRLAELSSKLPGDKSRLQLMLIADQSIFLPAPAADIPADAAPDAAAAREMLIKVANYVNQTVRQLPNLVATRFTNGFEDQPREEWASQNGFETSFYMPLHWVGSLKMQVTYRDRHEIQEKNVKAEKKGNGVWGLVTAGEFGPVLSTVLADAVKGKIVWARWEKGSDGKLAVFHYEVPEDKSNYYVKFCCIAEGFSSVSPEIQVWSKRAAYHSDIDFSPADGSIRLLTVDADMPAGALVSRAGMAIEYAPTVIGGHSYFCPVRSVSMLQKHTSHQLGANSRPNYEGPIQTFLNDIRFNNYRRFGSETKVLIDSPQD